MCYLGGFSTSLISRAWSRKDLQDSAVRYPPGIDVQLVHRSFPTEPIGRWRLTLSYYSHSFLLCQLQLLIVEVSPLGLDSKFGILHLYVIAVSQSEEPLITTDEYNKISDDTPTE